MFSVMEAFLMKIVVDIAQKGEWDRLIGSVVIIVITGVIVLLGYRFACIRYNVEAKRIYGKLYEQVLSHEMKLPCEYYENHHSGEMLSKVSFDLGRMGDIFGSRFRRVVMPFIMVVVFLVPMFVLSCRPAEGFEVKGYIEGMDPLIDPCVFVDDNGQAYIYNGGGGICKGGKLKDNMMELDGLMQPMEGLEDFHEATWVHKYNGKYYLSYSDNHDENWNDGVKGDNRMRYAVSDSPLGPWESKGIYMEPTDSYTNHGSIVEFKGQWYSFYHNSALSGHDWLRSICVDKLYYNPDGTIQIVKQTK